MPLLNVRLSIEEAALVKRLRERGLSISDLVREAIRARAADDVVPDDTDAVLQAMRERHPLEEKRTTSRRIDTTDRQAVQRRIRRALRKPRA